MNEDDIKKENRITWKFVACAQQHHLTITIDPVLE